MNTIILTLNNFNTMKSSIRLTLFFLLLSCFSGAQVEDYLQRIGAIKSKPYTIRDSSMLIELNQTASDSMFRNVEKAKTYAQLACQISKKIEYPRGIIESLHNLSRVELSLNKIDSAMIFAEESILLSKSIPAGKLLVRSYELKGAVYHFQTKYDKAINFYLKAVSVAERTNKEDAATGYVKIGIAFRQTGNRKMALEYQLKALRYSRKYHDSISLAGSLNNLGILAKIDKDYVKSLKYYMEGLKITEAIDYPKVEANLLNNIANTYFLLGESDVGMSYFERSLEISKNVKNFTDIAIKYHNLSFNLHELGRIEESLEASEKALVYADSAKSFLILVEANAMSARLYYDMGRFRDAYALLSYAYAYKDSMNLIALNDQSLDAEESYRLEKVAVTDSLAELQLVKEKHNEKILNDEKIHFREMLLVFSGLALFIVIIGLYFLYKSNKQVKSKNRIVEEQHAEITDSITYAKRIQHAMISNENAWKQISRHRFTLFKPKDVVSGDFYWAHFDTQKNIAIWAVADCTGHGVPGAFMSLLGTSFLNQIIIEGGYRKPGEILDQLRERVMQALEKNSQDQPKDGMDIGLCIWEKDSNVLHYAGANNPLWIIRKRENFTENPFRRIIDIPELEHVLLEVPPNKMPIGHFPGELKPFNTVTIKLCMGDTLILSTDGYADQFGGTLGKKLKSRPFKEILTRLQHENMNNQHSILEENFENWRRNEDQIDDVCVVGVRVS